MLPERMVNALIVGALLLIVGALLLAVLVGFVLGKL